MPFYRASESRERLLTFAHPAQIRRILPTDVEVYKRETQEVIRRFLLRKISFPECITGLNAAFAALLPRLTPEQYDEVRVVMLANNDLVMDEMARRDAEKAE